MNISQHYEVLSQGKSDTLILKASDGSFMVLSTSQFMVLSMY